MENIKPNLYFPYREEAVKLEKDSTAASKAVLHTCCNVNPICCLLWRQNPFFVSHTPRKPTFVGTQQPRCFPAMCRVRRSPVTWCRSDLPTSTWPPACPPLLSPLSSSVFSSCSCTGGCSCSSSSTLSQLALAREPQLLLKCCFTFWMMLSETTGKAAQITS